MSLQRTQAETTSTEFMDWIAYLDEDINDEKPLYNYLAQIAAEVKKSYTDSKYHERITIKAFLLKFITKKKTPEKMSIAEQTRLAKAKFGALFGVPKEKR